MVWAERKAGKNIRIASHFLDRFMVFMDYLTTANNSRLQGSKVFQKSFAVRIFKIMERKEMISGYRMVKGFISLTMYRSMVSISGSLFKKEWEHRSVPKHYHSLTKTILTASELRRSRVQHHCFLLGLQWLH